MNVYFISGLAADERVFKYIELPAGFTAVYLDWITPLEKESLAAYSLRMAEKIDQKSPFILLGLSMGGMIAAEIAKTYPPVRTILLSSVGVSSQLPPYFHWGAKLGLQNLVPVRLVKWASLIKRFFTTESEADKEALRVIIRESDPAFIKWALTAIVQWRNDIMPPGCIHIHGTRDEVLPIRFTTPQYRIKGAGHLMVINRAPVINAILKEELEKDMNKPLAAS